jgi:diguanylate cyclase (GGDEF)-like protein
MGEGRIAARRLPLTTVIQFTLAAALGAVIVVGLGLYVYLEHRGLSRARDAATLMTAQAVKAHARASVQSPTCDLQQFCTRLLEQPAVLGAALCDDDGCVVASAAVDENAEALVTASCCTSGGTTYSAEPVELPGSANRDPCAAERVVVDLALPQRPHEASRIAVLLMTPPILIEPNSGLGLFAAAMTGAGVGAFLIGAAYFKRRIVRPIARLMEAIAGVEPAAPVETQPRAADEVEAVAQSLSLLQDELGAWRERAERVERRLDWQIAAETQQITRDLRRVQREVWRDPLTGVNNRRLLDEKLPEIFAAQLGARQDLSVVMLDIDNLKTLNDTLGHKTGDDVLAFAGELLRESLRADDIAVRYGGDELVLVLPGLSAQNALATTLRLIALFAQRAKMMVDVRPAPTLSAGIASLHHNRPATAAELLQMADRALYQAKQAGKATARVCTNLEQRVA